MSWTTPTFDEIKMDAEIGSYQDDFDPARDVPAFILVRDNGDATGRGAPLRLF
jgi:hypothetical protein